MKKYINHSDLYGKKILVADDSSGLRNLLSRLFTYCGAETIEARNGKDALQYLSNEDNEIDLILMDINMPVVNGITAAKIIKNCEENNKIPLILFSSDHVMLKDIVKDHPFVEGIIPKPFKPVDILQKTVEVIKKSKKYSLNPDFI